MAHQRLGGKGDITDTAHVKHVGPKIGSDVPSPIAVDGKAYVLTDAKGKTNGQVMCYDITTGEPIWDEPFALPRAAGSYYSSPVKAGNLFYFSHEKGVIHVAKETETGLALITSNEMPERQIATIVPINDRILLRSETKLYLFE